MVWCITITCNLLGPGPNFSLLSKFERASRKRPRQRRVLSRQESSPRAFGSWSSGFPYYLSPIPKFVPRVPFKLAKPDLRKKGLLSAPSPDLEAFGPLSSGVPPYFPPNLSVASELGAWRFLYVLPCIHPPLAKSRPSRLPSQSRKFAFS